MKLESYSAIKNVKHIHLIYVNLPKVKSKKADVSYSLCVDDDLQKMKNFHFVHQVAPLFGAYMGRCLSTNSLCSNGWKNGLIKSFGLFFCFHVDLHLDYSKYVKVTLN